MLNYMKSESYRLRNSRSSYGMILVFSVLAVLFQIIMYRSKQADATFPYATTRFSLGFMVGSLQIILILCLVLASVIFAGEFKHGTIKNVVSFGISKNKLFIGKYLVTLIYALIYMIIVGAVYMGAAYILLENSGREYMVLFLKAFLVNIPLFVSCVTLGVSLFFAVQNETTGIWIWFILMVAVPIICLKLGGRIDLFAQLSDWMPWNMVTKGEQLDPRFVYDWETAKGAIKCFLAGTGLTALFFLLGLVKFQRTEIK